MQEKPSPQELEWRARILKECKVSSLYDAAFLVLRYNHHTLRESSTPALAIDLQEIFPNASASEINDAIAAAERLKSSCNQFVDYFYSANAPANLLEEIEKRHPGFSKDHYTFILGRAQFTATK